MENFDNLKKQLAELKKGAATVPNFLSLLRILFIPAFMYFFFIGKYKAGVLVVFLSGMTDALDGFIARRFNQISALGKLLDPAADKLTQITLAVALFIHFNRCASGQMRLFSWLFLLFCLKELVMMISSVVLLSMNIVPRAAAIYGKLATLVFYLVMGLLLCFAPSIGAFAKWFTLPDAVIMLLVSLSALLTVIALISYIPDTVIKVRKNRLLKQGETKEE